MTTTNRATKAKTAAQLTALCALVVFDPWLVCSSEPQQAPKAALPVTMAVGMLPLTSLAILADHEGLFTRAGVTVNVKKCATGVIAMDALLSGEAQVAVAGDTPVVFGSFKRRDFRILAGIASWDNDVTIVARKDRGISRPADLKGRRVATQKTSVAQFFLHMFLLKQGLSEKDVEIQYMPQARFPQALARGEADAASVREPFTSQAVALLGSNAVTFEEPGLYVEYYNLVASERFLREQPEAARQIVRALLAAEAFAKNQPARAQSIVARTISVPELTLQRVWPRLDLRVRLSQSLLVALEDQARWVIGSHLTEERAMPNFLRFIHLETMLAVKPSAVSIIR
ncbi:MAG: NrtA/SsuA/CpmA family ABC transporter substrate-binding protein [Verrucomicrobia bacterium]|nr:NrtA/SsuA/CpmA family ABC transporter substrate-binding protein [Verrucomicrobiota bacterium]